MSHISRELRLRLLTEFSCWGGDCPDSCCRAWNISVDETTLHSWAHLKDSRWKQILADSVLPGGIERETPSLKKQPDGACIHLLDSGLCRIQAELGHDLLPQTCREFPRSRIENHEWRFSTARLSCPAVVKLLSQDLDSALFDELHTDKTEQPTADTRQPHQQLEAMLHILMMRHAYPLNLRLYYLASILTELALASAEGRLDEAFFHKMCKTSVAGLEKQLKTLQKRIKNGQIKVNKQRTGGLWQVIFYYFWPNMQRVLSDVPDAGDFFDRLISWEPGSMQDQREQQHYLQVYQHIAKCRIDSRAYYPKDFEKFMSRYLLLRFMNHEFPVNPVEGNTIASFLLSVIPFMQVMLLIWLLSEKGKILEQDNIAGLIVKVEKALAHSPVIITVLRKNPQFLRLDQYAASLLDAI